MSNGCDKSVVNIPEINRPNEFHKIFSYSLPWSFLPIKGPKWATLVINIAYLAIIGSIPVHNNRGFAFISEGKLSIAPICLLYMKWSAAVKNKAPVIAEDITPK